MKGHLFLAIHLLLQQLKQYCLLFLKISGKVAVKSGSTAAEEGVWGWGVLGYRIVLDHTTCWGLE